MTECPEIHGLAKQNTILVKELQVKLTAAEAKITKRITEKHQREVSKLS